MGSVCSCRESIASIPVALMRPTRRRARSHMRSASATPADTTPRSGPPWPGSTTIRLPRSRGPAWRSSSCSRIRCGTPTGDLAAELAQRAQRGGPAQAVRDEAVLALEAAQRVLGLLVEHPTRAARVVAELGEPLLQRDDVVAGHRGRDHQRQHPVAERPARVAQRAVGGGPDDAVGDQPALLLEGPDGVLQLGVEGRIVPHRTGKAALPQHRPDLDDRGTAVTSAQQLHALLARLARA